MKPTVMDTIAFIQSDVVPILAWLADVVIAGAILELKAMGWTWQNILLPAIQAGVAWFVANLLPTLTTIFVALRDDLPRGIAVAVQSWTDFKTALGDFKTGYIDPITRGFDYVVTSVGSAKKQFDDFISGVTGAIIPSWLQGHSPPPLANWFSDIAGAADAASGAVGAVAPPGGSIPALPAFGASGGAGSGITVYVTVQGSVSTERDLILAVRDGLNALGRQNLSIFSADVTP